MDGNFKKPPCIIIPEKVNFSVSPIPSPYSDFFISKLSFHTEQISSMFCIWQYILCSNITTRLQYKVLEPDLVWVLFQEGNKESGPVTDCFESRLGNHLSSSECPQTLHWPCLLLVSVTSSSSPHSSSYRVLKTKASSYTNTFTYLNRRKMYWISLPDQ